MTENNSNPTGWLNADSPQIAGGSRPAGGQPREKVALKPGFGLLGWYALMNKSTSLNGVPGGRIIRVTMDEVKKHRSKEDAWTVIHGKVYNLGPYLEYHPGGVDKLMMVAGRDGSSMFDKYHPWVNVDSLLAKSLVGFLADPSENVASDIVTTDS